MVTRFCPHHGHKPYKFTRCGDIHGRKPYKFIGFGDIHGPKPYKFIGERADYDPLEPLGLGSPCRKNKNKNKFLPPTIVIFTEAAL